MVEAALYIITGTILYAGTHHLYLGTTRTSTQPHAQLAAMYLLLAGFVLIAALMYQPQEISTQLRLARLSMTMGILLWAALIWHVALYTRSKPLILLDLLTAAWVIFLIRNIGSPHGLLNADSASTDLTSLSGQNLSALYTGVNGWWTAVEFTMLASLLFCFYAGWRMFRRGNRQTALVLVSGLTILAATSLADHLLNTRVIHALYLAPFGFIGFLLANSLYLILLDYRNRRKAIPLPVIPRLTFNPERPSLNSALAELQPLSGEEPEAAVAQAPELAAAADWERLPPDERESPAKEGPPEQPLGMYHPSPSALGDEAAVHISVIKPGTKTGSKNSCGETGTQTAWQKRPTPMSQRDQSSLNTVSDNLIDIAVYATMVIKRFKRGDADPQLIETLCRKIRTRAIKTRRMANRLSRPGKPDNHEGSMGSDSIDR